MREQELNIRIKNYNQKINSENKVIKELNEELDELNSIIRNLDKNLNYFLDISSNNNTDLDDIESIASKSNSAKLFSNNISTLIRMDSKNKEQLFYDIKDSLISTAKSISTEIDDCYNNISIYKNEINNCNNQLLSYSKKYNISERISDYKWKID